jgi:hypothetical protein
MIDKMQAHKVLIQRNLEKAKRKKRDEIESRRATKKNVEHAEWLQDHICNLHERHLPHQYEVKILCDERL